MKTTQDFEPILTRHLRTQAEAKGVNIESVMDTFWTPSVIYESRNHPGQFRVIKGGLCLVVKPDGDKAVIITLYKNVEVTALRADQKGARIKA